MAVKHSNSDQAATLLRGFETNKTTCSISVPPGLNFSQELVSLVLKQAPGGGVTTVASGAQLSLLFLSGPLGAVCLLRFHTYLMCFHTFSEGPLV